MRKWCQLAPKVRVWNSGQGQPLRGRAEFDRFHVIPWWLKSRHPIYEFVIVCPKVSHLNYQFISFYIISFIIFPTKIVICCVFTISRHPINNMGRAIYFAAGFGFFGGFLVLCFLVSLIFCFSASLLFCFSAYIASLLFLLLCFSASLFSLLLCFCTSVPFYFYYSTVSSSRHVFLLLYFLLLCFFASCLYCLFVFHFLLLLFSPGS